MTKLFNLIIGGALGTVTRYYFSGLMYQLFGSSFPFGTFAVNMLGCFIIGLLASLSEDKFLLDTNARILLMVGFCGAFTTFSTFIFETSNLIKEGESMQAFLNISASVIVGFLLFRLGVLATKLI